MLIFDYTANLLVKGG